ncbi:hypothetical protein, partial [Secundilactobacillus kimchicus]
LTLPLWLPLLLWALPLLLGKGLGMILKAIWDLIKFVAGLVVGWLFAPLVLLSLALGLPLLLLTLPLWILPAILTAPFWLPILLGLLPFLVGKILAALA